MGVRKMSDIYHRKPPAKVLHWVKGFISSCSDRATHEAEKGPEEVKQQGVSVAGALGAWHPTESIERGASAALGWLANLCFHPCWNLSFCANVHSQLWIHAGYVGFTLRTHACAAKQTGSIILKQLVGKV